MSSNNSNENSEAKKIKILSIVIIFMLTILFLIGFNLLKSENQTPTIINFSSNLASPQSAGVNIAFIAESFDNDDNKIFYRFLVDSNVQQDWSEKNTWLWNTRGLKARNYSIQAQIKDMKHGKSKNDFDSCKFILYYIDNQPPEILKLHSDHSSPSSSGTYIEWTAESYDKNGDEIYYRFLVDGNVEQNWSKLNNWTWDTQKLETKQYLVHVQLKDKKHTINGDEYDTEKRILFKIKKPYGVKDLLTDAADIASMYSGIGEIRYLGKKAIHYLRS